jgi:Sensors of blue-light using FAD
MNTPIHPTEPLFQLIYESMAARSFSEEEVKVLLDDSRRSNLRKGITGILLYRQGQFTQVLEGNEFEVKQLFERISRDPRHTRVVVRLEQWIPARSFPNWSMAYSRKELSDYLRI